MSSLARSSATTADETAVGRAPLAAWPLILALRAHRLLLSPLLGPSCRFEPSCSRYAEHALRAHGLVTAIGLVLFRLARCHPWGGGGFDPVPQSLRRGSRNGG